MKNIVKQIFLLSLLVAVFASCKKDENKNYFEGGTAPVLKASSTAAMVLDSTKKNNTAVVFTWTNPNYQFNTGNSSQDVIYILQIDTTGANFKNPNIQEVAIPKELSVTYTIKDINTFLSKLDVLENIPHNIEFRIKSTIAGNAVPLYSNVVKIVITPYLDVAVPIPPTGDLYITGDGTPSSWTNNPPASQKCIKVSKVEYNITMSFTPGFYYKFLSTLNNWQPQYGGKVATGGDIGFNMGGGSDPDAIPTPSIAGSYKVTVNFKTGKYTVVKQ
ncbi:SusE domain-containing protein [Ferruginibacter sp. SUN106]|uniref:SusE domain-containing protein n=1 Tax=Ferruginibacter sp. SUN106 TaxID=2978348 RepID=UPI003D36E3B1